MKLSNTLLIVLVDVMIVLWGIVSACSRPAKSGDRGFDEYSGVTSRELMTAADSLYDVEPDSALLLFTVVANRFEPDMPGGEKQLALKAALSRWELIFFNHFDYTTGFDALSRAESMAGEMNVTEPRIALYTGHMFHTAYEQTLADDPGLQALEAFRTALRQGIETGNRSVAKMAFANLVELGHSLNRLDSIENEAAAYNAMNWGGENDDFENGFYEALLSLDHGNAPHCIAMLDSIEQTLDTLNIRYRCALSLLRAEALMQDGLNGRALAQLDSVEQLTLAHDLRDGRLAMYKLRSEAYDREGDGRTASEWSVKYIMLKDSLLNYQKVEQLSKRKFINQMNCMERSIVDLRQQRKMHVWIIVIISLAILCVGGILVLLYRKNKTLSMANDALYRKTAELLRNDDERRRGSGEKYKGSTLHDSAKESLWEAVCRALDTSNEIYSAEFSLARLCELCDSKEKYVSQVINEHGENFSTLLNNRRIDEACRRMDDPEMFRNLTLEAVGNSVGFKSANAFRANFRRRTGLTPSQYQRAAASNKSAFS
ncbi:MAG: AraC family transcriptional regulator [Muribaculaceae bacterium]|nr:AraC family transcriptional regulator [Muribaculaceae bacterium]